VTTSHIPAAIDAIVASFTAAGIRVFDGPVITGDFDAAVFVGYDGAADNSDFKAVAGTQDWAGLGAKRRSEAFSIVCAAVALTGETDTKTGRDAVYALLDTAGTTLRADPSLGLNSPPFVAELKPVDLFTEPTSNGLQCRWVFTIDISVSRV
jgi:hypothetical protein